MGSGGDRAAGEPVIGMMDRREALLLVDRLKRRTRDPEAFLLLVTWLAYDQPPSHYQVPFNSNEACEAARQQLIKDAERIRQRRLTAALQPLVRRCRGSSSRQVATATRSA
jgi:hypothetical protein